MIKCLLVFVESTRFSCHVLMKVEYYRQILQKYTYVSNFMKIPPVGAKYSMRTDGQIYIHDEANSRFSQFCDSA
jgi:hypothetical protein